MKKSDLAPRAAVLMAVLVFLTAFCADASAYKYSAIDESQQDSSVGASRKLGRGLANAGLGWTDVFRGMQDVSDESGFWAGATWGPLYGTVKAVRRTALGIYETATFPFPGPDHYEPVLRPEFPLDND